MKLTNNLRIQIDNMSYADMLKHWRFSLAGDHFFTGETGDYYVKIMREKRKLVGESFHVMVSKQIGWTK